LWVSPAARGSGLVWRFLSPGLSERPPKKGPTFVWQIGSSFAHRPGVIRAGALEDPESRLLSGGPGFTGGFSANPKIFDLADRKRGLAGGTAALPFRTRRKESGLIRRGDHLVLRGVPPGHGSTDVREHHVGSRHWQVPRCRPIARPRPRWRENPRHFVRASPKPQSGRYVQPSERQPRSVASILFRVNAPA
jgi:hypothetical protein